MSEEQPRVAYFSMEIALESGVPTYSGGLGVLAGDTLRAGADLGLSVCAVTLLHREGYFRQEIGEGRQRELPQPWVPDGRLEPLAPRVEVAGPAGPVQVRAWRYLVIGAHGHRVPVYLLDTHLDRNPPEVRSWTDRLYGGDDAYRLAQELVLGVGGVRMLRALGHRSIDCFHLNEGHAALAIAELLEEAIAAEAGDVARALQSVRAHCVFTTHTPVPAGHDRFPRALVRRVLGETLAGRLAELDCGGDLNMTELALRGSRYVNGVAMRHGEVSRDMFPGHPIGTITNGVHPATWVSPPFERLFDRHFPHWRSDPFSLRGALDVPLGEIADAHAEAKHLLLDTVAQKTGRILESEPLTLGFGRRATAYKRPLLILSDPERLEAIARRFGGLQLVFAGKAHPRDHEGRSTIESIHRAAEEAPDALRVVFVPDYDMALGARLVAGCDVWLNTPIPPLEASGTSGMKAALNGVPSLSVLDGWWIEGCIEGVTGWAIGADGDERALSPEERDHLHADSLYTKLERVVAPAFHAEPEAFRRVMRQAIAMNGSHFHTHRMVLEYRHEAYRAGAEAIAPGGRARARTGSD